MYKAVSYGLQNIGPNFAVDKSQSYFNGGVKLVGGFIGSPSLEMKKRRDPCRCSLAKENVAHLAGLEEIQTVGMNET